MNITTCIGFAFTDRYAYILSQHIQYKLFASRYCCHFSFPGCPVQVERRGLEAHLSECNFRSRECPNGCGHTLHSIDQSQHNCVAELRTEVELLRQVCPVIEILSELKGNISYFV